MTHPWLERLVAQRDQLEDRLRETALELVILKTEQRKLVARALDSECGFTIFATLHVEGPKNAHLLVSQFGPEVLPVMCDLYAGRVIDREAETFYLTEEGKHVVANIERVLGKPLNDYQ